MDIQSHRPHWIRSNARRWARVGVLMASVGATYETATGIAHGATPTIDAIAKSDANEWVPATQTNPRLKLSYRQFSISNVDDSTVPLRGAELNVYPLSRRWIRAGADLEAGGGTATLNGVDIGLRYGMVGGTLGFQYPARITPFIDGRVVGGVMTGNLDSAVPIPGTSVTVGPVSAATWIYGRGIDVGAEFFTVGRMYVSASVGWLRTTWHGVDYAGIMQNPGAGIQYKDLTSDGFTFKLGVGI